VTAHAATHPTVHVHVPTPVHSPPRPTPHSARSLETRSSLVALAGRTPTQGTRQSSERRPVTTPVPGMGRMRRGSADVPSRQTPDSSAQTPAPHARCSIQIHAPRRPRSRHYLPTPSAPGVPESVRRPRRSTIPGPWLPNTRDARARSPGAEREGRAAGSRSHEAAVRAPGRTEQHSQRHSTQSLSLRSLAPRNEVKQSPLQTHARTRWPACKNGSRSSHGYRRKPFRAT